MRATAAVVATLAFALGGPASAEWIALPDNGGVALALDSAGPTEVSPGMRQVWVLEDGLPQDASSDPRSRKTLWAMDCQRQRMGIKAFVSYAAAKGAGKPSVSHFHPWAEVRMDDVVPDTIGSVLFKLTCGASIGAPRPSM